MGKPGTGHSLLDDSGAYTKAVFAFAPQVKTAVVTDLEIAGSAVDRCDPNVALSAKVVIPAHIVLASGHSVVMKRHIDSRDDSDDSWHLYADAEPDDLTVEANNDGSAIDTDVGFDVDLAGAKQEIRLRVTADFSASGVDTAALGASFVFGGYDTNPAG